MQIFNNAQASRTYTPLTSASAQSAKAAAHSGDLKLTVDCGGSVGSVYLAKTKLYKTLVGSGSANPLHWMYYAYTGTMGKGQLTIHLDDYLSYQISTMTFTDPDTNEKVDLKNLPETEQARIKMVMEQLVERHMTYRNIKLYYTETMPAASSSNLSTGDLLWDLGGFTGTGSRGDRSRQFTFTVTLAAGASGVVEKDGTAEAAFVNHKPGSHSDTKKTKLTVVKQWAGSGSHPASVLVQLLRDGEPYGNPVRLQAANASNKRRTGELGLPSQFPAFKRSL